MRRTSLQQKISLTLMCAALCLVALYFSAMVGAAGYALCAVASVFLYILTSEDCFFCAMLSFVIAAAVGFIIVPSKVHVAIFALIAGHYPVFKAAIDKIIKNKLAAMCIKLLYCNFFVIAAMVCAMFVFNVSIPSDFPLPVWAAVLLGEAAFALNDLVHSLVRWFYVENFRP